MPVTAKHIESIYGAFRKAQADYNNRGYRLPKDFEKHFNIKFKEVNKKSLIKITGWFLTKWQDIDPYEYFMCGFDLFKKNFTYAKFFNEKIILLYKTRDKNKKRNIQITKQALIRSALYVKKWMEKNNASLDEYMGTREGNQKIAVSHYLNNKIDAIFLVFLIQKGMLLTDNERGVIPYVHNKYRDIVCGLGEIRDFTRKLEEKL
jgi:hypothetical protein